jgi:hypothetical protein
MKGLVLTLLTVLTVTCAKSQIVPEYLSNEVLDSLYIKEVEEKRGPAKLLHAEPLYIDLIRDLGARKGEKEWNVGFGLTDKNHYDKFEGLIEYEFAPVDRLGLEIEVPFSLNRPTLESGSVPGSKINSLKLAAQYTFLVSEKAKTSLALGYIHEFEFTEFKKYGIDRFVNGNIFNPFFISAKRWGQNFHTLLYTGPVIEHHFYDNSFHKHWQINSNFHYMITGTRNFVGIEVNKEKHLHGMEVVLRPQMRFGIADNLLVGIVTGIPVTKENQRFSSFVRLIYEPGHKVRH